MHRSPLLVALVALVAVGCTSARPTADSAPTPKPKPKRHILAGRERAQPQGPAQRVLGLPPVTRGPLPGYLLIADRNNDRAVIVSPSRQVVWQDTGLRGPDDTFFTPGFHTIITNEEFNDTLTEVSLRTKARVWRYGHDAAPGASPGYLNTPDDAYRLANGATSIADIKNCRIVQLTHSRRVLRIFGGSCVHDPPRGFASPNGDTPLPDGGLLVTEIGPPGWIDRLAPAGRVLWSIRSPVAYPSDAQLLPNGRVLVASFTNPGKIVEVTPSGHVTWSFGAASGPNELNKPSLAVMLPNGLIASNDDYNHRVILIDPRTKQIVWQYGHTGVAGSGNGYLNKPDGLDLLPSAFAATTSVRRAPANVHVGVARVGSLPASVSKSAAVALPNGQLLVLGGLAGGTSSSQVLAGTPEHLRTVGSLPVPTHDAAATTSGRFAILYGGGEAVSMPTVVRVDPATGSARRLRPLDEPLSDLGAATVGRTTYLVGGYTGSRFASAILRVGPTDRTTTVARLPTGLRYAGVAALNGKIYVAGGRATAGDSRAVLVFDPAAGTVLRIGTLPRPTAHVALAALGGTLYLAGGGSRYVLAIDPATGRSHRVATLPQPLTDPNAVTLGTRIVILGGGTNAVYALTAR